MVKAIIFDCFGVLINDVDGSRNVKLLEYVKKLRQSYKTAIVSNVGKGGLHRYFTDDELKNDFDVAITSGDVGMLKPDPEIFLHVSQRLGVEPEECVFIDDNERHCNGSKATGMQSIQYRIFEQTRDELETLLNYTKS